MKHALPSSAFDLAAARSRLATLIEQFSPSDGTHATHIPGMHLIRASAIAPYSPVIYQPRICIVAQGSKTACFADQYYRYDPMHFLVVTFTLPIASQIVQASKNKPFLCLRLDIDPEPIRELMLALPTQSHAETSLPGLYAAPIDALLLEPVLRLTQLLETPQDARVLASAVIREIHYRVLTGPMGQPLRDSIARGSHTQRMARAVAWLSERYRRPLQIDTMANALHMSVSALHHQFKQATSLSPLQFQKRLRLHEARRMMSTEGLDANTTAHRVGYESASQFNREYKRLFGAPPKRDTQR